jgi:hypothetical protein
LHEQSVLLLLVLGQLIERYEVRVERRRDADDEHREAGPADEPGDRIEAN